MKKLIYVGKNNEFLFLDKYLKTFSFINHNSSTPCSEPYQKKPNGEKLKTLMLITGKKKTIPEAKKFLETINTSIIKQITFDFNTIGNEAIYFATDRPTTEILVDKSIQLISGSIFFKWGSVDSNEINMSTFAYDEFVHLKPTDLPNMELDDNAGPSDGNAGPIAAGPTTNAPLPSSEHENTNVHQHASDNIQHANDNNGKNSNKSWSELDDTPPMIAVGSNKRQKRNKKHTSQEVVVK